jgi:tetratricopeptide (TPR) repeat protein
LVNLNAEKSNYPAADLGDKAKRIAIQITNQEGSDKITETAAKAAKHHLGNDFDKLIIFFLLPKKPAIPKQFVQPANGPAIECWDLADLLKQMPELPDQSRLQKALDALEKDLGLSGTKEPFYPSNLPGIYTGCLFLGRDDFLKDLRVSLLKQTHATAITQRSAATGIAGLGGIGKTHAAVEYARLYREDYAAQLFVSGDTSERLDTGFSALFDTLCLGIPGEVQGDQTVRITALKNWFIGNRDWLLIVDNVDDKAAAAALTGYLGSLTQGHVLITSCLQNWGSNVETLNIEVLSTEDSTYLLLQLTEGKRRRADDEAAPVRRLAELLEGLPLALHQAAGYIKEQSLSFAGYIAHYEQEAAGVLDWFESHIIPYERPDMLARKPVLITWKTSFDKLDSDTRFWLLVFAHYAPDPIPEFLLDSALDAADEVKNLHRVARNALSQAKSYSLTTRDLDRHHFKLHRLVQHFIRLSASEQKKTAALEMGILLIRICRPGDPSDVHSWLRWNPLQSHAVALTAHAPDTIARDSLSWLLGCLAMLLKNKSLYTHAEPYYRRAWKIDEANHGPDHPVVANRLSNLALLLQDTNRLMEAEELMRRALSIDEASYDDNHSSIAIRLNNLAGLLQDTERYEEAESLFRRALAIAESNYETNPEDVAPYVSNLSSLLQATDRLDEAEPLMRRALQVSKDCFGLDHPNVSTCLNNLAMLLMATDRQGEAEPLLVLALQINEDSYGPDHTQVATSLNNLAGLLHDTNRLAEAAPLMRRAVSILVRRLSVDHPKILEVANSYAGLLLDLELPEAEVRHRVQAAVEGR